MYAATRLSITDPLSVTLGARINYSSNSRCRPTVRAAINSKTVSSRLTWAQCGDQTTPYSLYASYTDILYLQSEENANGNKIEPIRGGQSYENRY